MIWREREGAGEGEIDQKMTKNQRWRYLRARVSTTELRTSSAARFEAPEWRSYGGGECEL